MASGSNYKADSSFDELYNRYFQGLYRFAWHYVMCEEAKDIVQEVFITYYEKRDGLAGISNIGSYLLAATRNRCINFLRRQDIVDRNESRLLETVLSWYNDASEETPELTREINRCMDLLTDQQKAVLRFKMEGRSYAEIAEILQVSTGTVTTHLTRAYKVFRDNFNNIMTACLLLPHVF